MIFVAAFLCYISQCKTERENHKTFSCVLAAVTWRQLAGHKMRISWDEVKDFLSLFYLKLPCTEPQMHCGISGNYFVFHAYRLPWQHQSALCVNRKVKLTKEIKSLEDRTIQFPKQIKWKYQGPQTTRYFLPSTMLACEDPLKNNPMEVIKVRKVCFVTP